MITTWPSDAPALGPCPTPAPPSIQVPWTPAEMGWERLETVASPLVGIAHRLFAQLHDVDDIRMGSVGAQACDSRWLLGAACNELNGGGSADPRQARAAAIGETVERYSGAWVDSASLRVATGQELEEQGIEHVGPGEFTPFAESQYGEHEFPFVRFDNRTRLAWMPTVDLWSHEQVMAPAQLMYLVNGVLGDTPIGYSTSNGLACGCTWEESVLSGLLEVVERDAFMATWYGRLVLDQIDPDSDVELGRFMQRHVMATGLRVSLVNLSPLVAVPAVLAVVRNQANHVAPLALGAASSTSPRIAAQKAIVEAFQTRTWAKAEQREGSVIDPAQGFDQVKDFDDHVRLSLHPRAVAQASFLDSSTRRVDLASLPEVESDTPGLAVREIARRLHQQGIQALAGDLTSPDVREAGLVVAKVMAPGLSSLDSGYQARMLGSPRLRERAANIGLLDRPIASSDLNPWPHPFP